MGAQGGEYVITYELGILVHLEWYSDEFGRLLQITLYDSRHATLTLMEHAGVQSLSRCPACPRPAPWGAPARWQPLGMGPHVPRRESKSRDIVV